MLLIVLVSNVDKPLQTTLWLLVNWVENSTWYSPSSLRWVKFASLANPKRRLCTHWIPLPQTVYDMVLSQNCCKVRRGSRHSYFCFNFFPFCSEVSFRAVDGSNNCDSTKSLSDFFIAFNQRWRSCIFFLMTIMNYPV